MFMKDNYMFQQDRTLSHTANLVQNGCKTFVTRDEETPNSPDLSPLDYIV